MRALLPGGGEAVAAGRKVLARLDLIRISSGVLDEAAVLAPADLRSLEAIHLATARRLGRDLGTIITYDERMAEAATHLGHRVVAPR
jgi:predicted nucleic acid-binding protein